MTRSRGRPAGSTTHTTLEGFDIHLRTDHDQTDGGAEGFADGFDGATC